MSNVLFAATNCEATSIGCFMKWGTGRAVNNRIYFGTFLYENARNVPVAGRAGINQWRSTVNVSGINLLNRGRLMFEYKDDLIAEVPTLLLLSEISRRQSGHGCRPRGEESTSPVPR